MQVLTKLQQVHAMRPCASRGTHFAIGYSATTPGRTVSGKAIQNPVTLRFAVDNGRVIAINVYVDLAGEV